MRCVSQVPDDLLWNLAMESSEAPLRDVLHDQTGVIAAMQATLQGAWIFSPGHVHLSIYLKLVDMYTWSPDWKGVNHFFHVDKRMRLMQTQYSLQVKQL
jgi:hypothetical protein